MHPLRKQLLTGLALALLLAAAPGLAPAMPDSIRLDTMAEYYGGVEFDHAIHVEMAEDCATCHHHTVGTPPRDPACLRCHDIDRPTSTAACADCHDADPFSVAYLQEKEEDTGRYHTDKPGLKAAYHLACLGCHQEMGAPAGCEDCHARTEAGEALYRSGAHAPQTPAGGAAVH